MVTARKFSLKSYFAVLSGGEAAAPCSAARAGLTFTPWQAGLVHQYRVHHTIINDLIIQRRKAAISKSSKSAMQLLSDASLLRLNKCHRRQRPS